MKQLEGTDEATALEQARERLEAALNGNEHWRALRHGGADTDRKGHERALADNALYKSWKAVDEALESLRTAGKPEPVTGEPSSDVDSGVPADDLMRIRGISADLASRLNALGVARYAQIAAWGSSDVRKVAEALGLDRAISRQNWIEQAALLARRAPAARAAAIAHSASEASPSIIAAAAETAAPEGPHRADAREALEATVDPPDDAIDLPDILERIRSDAASRADKLPAVSLDTEVAPQPEPDVDDDDAEAEAERIEANEPEAPEPALSVAGTGPVASPAAVPRSPIPTVAASSHVNTDAAARAKRLEEDRRRLSESQLDPDVVEATVTFVIQEDRSEQRGLRSDTLSRLGADQRAPTETPSETFVPPSNPAEEAEVVIVSAQGASHSGRRTGSVRRFLKDLTGS